RRASIYYNGQVRASRSLSHLPIAASSAARLHTGRGAVRPDRLAGMPRSPLNSVLHHCTKRSFMRRLTYSLIGAIVLATLAAPAAAQQDTKAEEQAVRAVVDRLFDGMRSRDTTMMRSVFADEAQFY